MSHLLVMVCLVISSVISAKVDKVKVDCGIFPHVPAVITFTGDARAVNAYAADGVVCPFVESTGVGQFSKTVHYKANTKCRFTQPAAERLTFTVTVETRTMHPLVEVLGDEKYMITCNYMVWAKVNRIFNVASSFNPPIMKFTNKAKQSKSVFTVFMVNIKGDKLTGPMTEKRVVKLRVQMKPPLKNEVKEVGFSPLQCVAEPERGGSKLVILSDGCGTGFPWKNNQGFVMKGMFGDSPKFRLFKLHRKQGLKISCHFVICTAPCNYNSCPAARKLVAKRGKRDVDGVNYVTGRITTTVAIVNNKTAPYNRTTVHRVNIADVPRVNLTFLRTKPEMQSDETDTADYIKLTKKVNALPVYTENRATVFIAISTFSSVILLVTICLTTFILSKIHQTHLKILQLRKSHK